MKNYLFDSLRQWKVCMLSGCKEFGRGVGRILSCCFFGVVSVFVYCGKQIEAFCRRETIAAVIISIIFLLMAGGWFYTFVAGRTEQVSIQHKADSLSYSLEKIMQAYDSVVVDGDTLKYETKSK